MRRAEFRRIRKRLGLSREECAALLRVHPLTIYKWERGDQSIPGPVTVLMEWVDPGPRRGAKRR